MNNKYFTFLILLACFQLTGQNSVSNGSFEAGSCIPDNSYSTVTGKGVSFENCLNVWEACGKRGAPNTSHSPDWFRNFNSPSTMIAQEGSRFVHMVNYEAIQQKLNNEFTDGAYYWISAWVKLNSNLGGIRDFSTAALNIYLGGSGLTGNKRFEYEADPDPNSPSDPCEPSYRNLIANDKRLLKQVDLSGYPLDEWVQIHFIYNYQDSKKHDLIAFELIDTDADNKVLNCTPASICLDNIEIMDPCAHPCAPDLPPLVYLPTGQIDGNDVVELFENYIRIDYNDKITCAIVENANSIVFKIYDRWGNVRFSRNWFDVNGLKNYLPSPNQQFRVLWNGEDNSGNPVTTDVYTYSLWVYQCSSGKFQQFHGSITFVDYFKGGGYTNYPPPWTTTPLDIDCCNPGSTTIDDVITGGFKVSYEENITTEGDAVFTGTGLQVLRAGQSIDLLPNTTISSETSFDAQIRSCEETNISLKTELSSDTPHSRKTLKMIQVYPNPAKDYSVIMAEQTAVTRIRLTDIQGRSLYNEQVDGFQIIIDLSTYNQGVYVVEVIDSEGEVHAFKLIHQ